MKTRVSWLDFKLGFRMLARYPGLTLVGGLAMAFAIWVGAGTFEFVRQVLYPSLPLEDGDRIVGIENWDAAAGRAESQILHDLVDWRDQLESVRDLGAFRTVQRNLITGEGRGEPVEVAEMSPSGFQVARVPPLLGRALLPSDAEAGAPPVVVIGHDVWRQRFGGDPGVVGTTLRLGASAATIVGVMPEGFGFPVSHQLWAPLRLNALDYARRAGPGLEAFGRLAEGATMEEAQAELTAVGRRAAAEFPETHEHLRPRVLPYAKSVLNLSGGDSLIIGSSNLFLVMLLVLVCGNVALLMFARASARETELVVRNALGASRGRIIGQLFAEALVLTGLAALIGLGGAGLALRWGFSVVEAELLHGVRLPFWFDDDISPLTILYAAGLTLFGAIIAGVVPGLKVTRGLGTRLRQAAPGGGGFRFGGVWTAVIVAQVAVTVAFPAMAFFVGREAGQAADVEVGFPAQDYLKARLEMEGELSADAVRELERRVTGEAAVAGATFADRFPLMYHPARLIELDEGGGAPLDPRWPGGYRVSSSNVAPDFFEVLDVPILGGRGFHEGDALPEARTIIVNESFVERVLGGRNPIGRRVRYLHFEEWDEPRPDQEPGPWHQIVGVVRDMKMAEQWDPKSAGFYHAATPAAIAPLHMAVRVRGETAAFEPRLRRIATAVDPSLRVHDVMPLDQVVAGEVRFLSFWFWLTMLVSGVALILSLAGIYSVMAFTVSQRTREIGIRLALGANARRLVAGVFRRPLTQVSFGILAGAVLVTAIMVSIYGRDFGPRQGALIVLYGLVMIGVCMLGCVLPTLRALRVEPTEALRAEG